jgi:AraC-like DNA-binding protein
MPVSICQLELDKKRKQLNLQGSHLFPCSSYYTDIVNNMAGFLDWHWHEEVEFFIVKKGIVKLQINEDIYLLNEGSGAFVNTNILHSIQAQEAGVLHSLVFAPVLLSGTVNTIFEQRYVRPLLDSELATIIFRQDVPWEKRVLEILDETYVVYEEKGFGYEVYVRDNLSKIWLMIMTHHKTKLKPQPSQENIDTRRLKEILDFIYSNYQNPITLSDIAKEVNLSERSCLRCFKRFTGSSPMKFMLEYRLSMAAKTLLENRELSITQVSLQSGFDSPSYFSKKFKEYMKSSPRSYRKSNQVATLP